MKARALLLVAVISLMGCGGGKGPVQPPSNPSSNPPSPSQPTDVPTRIVGAGPVESGGTVIFELTTGDPTKDQILAEATVSWSHEPAQPALSFKKLQDSRHWQVSFPQVSNEVVYTISFVGVNHQASIRFRGQTQIRVIPSPPVKPPKVYLRYPADWPEDVRTAGNGTKLKIVGEAYPGSYPITKLRVTDQGTILQEWPFNGGLNGGPFGVDLENFGSPGRKVVQVEAVDSQGNVGSTELELIHDPMELEKRARQFLLEYACTPDGRAVRFGDRDDGPFAKPVRIWINSVQEYRDIIMQACEFWTRYSRIQFELVVSDEVTKPYVIIEAKFTENPKAYAETIRTGDSFPKITGGVIYLYKGWLSLSDEYRSLVIAHELGHVLLVPDSREGHTTNGSFMDAGATEWNFHPYMQLAVRILYSKNPGEPL